MRAVAYAEPSSSPTRLRLVVPGSLGERERALRFVGSACRAHELPADVEDALVSAVSEAFNHAVLDSYAAESGAVTLELELHAGRVVATLRDRGAGGNGGPGARRVERRYGLFIILRAMDEVRWFRDGDDNIVTMVKRLPRLG